MERVVLAIAAALTATLSACSQSSAVPAKTQVLPADGGDVGKTWVAYVDALKRTDMNAASIALAKPDVLKRSSAKDLLDSIGNAMPVGGRQQGDRATLFLVSGSGDNPYYILHNATRVSGVWKFDTALLAGTGFPDPPRDCGAGRVFPCGVKSAPDAVVSGTVPPMHDGEARQPLIDGFAVHTTKDGAPSGTLIELAGHGINPTMLTFSGDPDNVEQWIGWPMLRIAVRPDNKHAEVLYSNGLHSTKFDVSDGLSIESTDNGRIRGRLKTSTREIGALDAYFDIAALSTCDSGGYHCDK